MAEIHRKDYDSFREYNRERMRLVNGKKHYKERLDRFREVYELIKQYEENNMDKENVIKRLADTCKYKLQEDKTIKEGGQYAN